MNLKAILPYIRRYPLSLICIAVIWYLSIWFLPPDLPELRGVKFIDKWTHFVMYGGFCSVIWWEYLRSHSRTHFLRLLIFAWVAPILMSGILELVQAYCTTNRAGEWLDLAANATGCTLGIGIGLVMKKFIFTDPSRKGGC